MNICSYLLIYCGFIISWSIFSTITHMLPVMTRQWVFIVWLTFLFLSLLCCMQFYIPMDCIKTQPCCICFWKWKSKSTVSKIIYAIQIVISTVDHKRCQQSARGLAEHRVWAVEAVKFIAVSRKLWHSAKQHTMFGILDRMGALLEEAIPTLYHKWQTEIISMG